MCFVRNSWDVFTRWLQTNQESIKMIEDIFAGRITNHSLDSFPVAGISEELLRETGIRSPEDLCREGKPDLNQLFKLWSHVQQKISSSLGTYAAGHMSFHSSPKVGTGQLSTQLDGYRELLTDIQQLKGNLRGKLKDITCSVTANRSELAEVKSSTAANRLNTLQSVNPLSNGNTNGARPSMRTEPSTPVVYKPAHTILTTPEAVKAITEVIWKETMELTHSEGPALPTVPPASGGHIDVGASKGVNTERREVEKCKMRRQWLITSFRQPKKALIANIPRHNYP